MPQYVYRCKDVSGKRKKGKLSAPDPSAAKEELQRKHWIVLELNEFRETWYNKQIYLTSPVKNEHFVIFCRQFATLIRAGITIVDASRILSQQTESKVLGQVLAEVTNSLRKGNSFSQSVSVYRKIFPPIFVNMVRAGEESGKIDETLERLAVFFEKQHQSREKIKSAMAYPMIVSILTIGVVIFLLKFVIPRFQTMYGQMGAQLPIMTKLVLRASYIVQHYWYDTLAGMAAWVLLFYLFKRSKRGKYSLDYIKLKIPVFGRLNQKGAIAQMTRTLASLYSSSVPVLQSLTIVENVIDNEIYRKYLDQAKDSLRKGQPLSDPLKRSWVFPPMVTQMMAIGEETGSLDDMLEKIADFYENDVENTVDRLKTLIEPIMILVLSGVVGAIVASIIMPMYSLYGHILQ